MSRSKGRKGNIVEIGNVQWFNKKRGFGGVRKGKPQVKVWERQVSVNKAAHLMLGAPEYIAFGVTPNGEESAALYVAVRDGSIADEDRKTQREGHTRVVMDHAFRLGTYSLELIAPGVAKAEVPYRVFTPGDPKVF
jgi:hypothetical protein